MIKNHPVRLILTYAIASHFMHYQLRENLLLPSVLNMTKTQSDAV